LLGDSGKNVKDDEVKIVAVSFARRAMRER